MAPDSDTTFHVACENGFEGELSADALGITACLYAYSHISFVLGSALAQTCAEQYHLLREFALDHPGGPGASWRRPTEGGRRGGGR
jgi:hypothetical protein